MPGKARAVPDGRWGSRSEQLQAAGGPIRSRSLPAGRQAVRVVVAALAGQRLERRLEERQMVMPCQTVTRRGCVYSSDMVQWWNFDPQIRVPPQYLKVANSVNWALRVFEN